MSGYIYIVQTPAYRGTDVFKVGRTWQRLSKVATSFDRLKTYPKGTQVVALLAVPEGTETRVETHLKEVLKEQFELVRGQEWFRAPLAELLPLVTQQVCSLCTPEPCRTPLEVAVDPQDEVLPPDEQDGTEAAAAAVAVPVEAIPVERPESVPRIPVAAAVRLAAERLAAEGRYSFCKGCFWTRDDANGVWRVLTHEREHFARRLPELYESLQLPLEVTHTVVSRVMREGAVILARVETDVEEPVARFVRDRLVRGGPSDVVTLSMLREGLKEWASENGVEHALRAMKLSEMKAEFEKELGEWQNLLWANGKLHRNALQGWILTRADID